MSEQPEPMTVANVAAWHRWLVKNDERSDGVWLVLAKKGVTSPTSLTYQEALEEALCSGWIDGQVKSVDAATFKQRFTPRRARSVWSQRNVGLIARLTDEGRLRPRGLAEVERAKADGRWDRAYAGSATVEVPDDFAAALRKAPAAKRAFDGLNRAERYSALHPILTAHTETTRARRIDRLITRLTDQ